MSSDRLRLLVRALLAAVAIVVLIPTTVTIAGAWFPFLPSVGAFVAVINTGLPWLLVAAAVATTLAAAAAVLGGRALSVLVALSLAVLLGAGAIAARYTAFAAAHGASYDMLRALDGFPPIPEGHARAVFAEVEGIELQAEVWYPDGYRTAAARSLPAVVFVHGGAFIGGGLGTRPTLLGALAASGIVAVDVEYRLAPPPRWDDAPADVLCALGWLPGAEELAMVDPAHVVLVGESAGGSLALVAGFAAGTDEIRSSCPEHGAPVVPAGVMATAPAADLEGIWRDATIYDFAGERFPEAYVGGSPDELPERYAAASPFRLVRAGLPPTLILAGESDRLVRLPRITAIVDAIRAAGSEVEFLVAPFAGHGFDGEPNSFGAQLSEAIVPAFVRRVAPATSQSSTAYESPRRQ